MVLDLKILDWSNSWNLIPHIVLLISQLPEIIQKCFYTPWDMSQPYSTFVAGDIIQTTLGTFFGGHFILGKKSYQSQIHSGARCPILFNVFKCLGHYRLQGKPREVHTLCLDTDRCDKCKNLHTTGPWSWVADNVLTIGPIGCLATSSIHRKISWRELESTSWGCARPSSAQNWIGLYFNFL